MRRCTSSHLRTMRIGTAVLHRAAVRLRVLRHHPDLSAVLRRIPRRILRLDGGADGGTDNVIGTLHQRLYFSDLSMLRLIAHVMCGHLLRAYNFALTRWRILSCTMRQQNNSVQPLPLSPAPTTVRLRDAFEHFPGPSDAKSLLGRQPACVTARPCWVVHAVDGLSPPCLESPIAHAVICCASMTSNAAASEAQVCCAVLCISSRDPAAHRCQAATDCCAPPGRHSWSRRPRCASRRCAHHAARIRAGGCSHCRG